jgi:GNAT superfamily N-acetyltransferase
VRSIVVLAVMRLALKLDLGPEYDSNAKRAEVIEGATNADRPIGSALMRTTARAGLIWQKGISTMRLNGTLGGKLFFNPDKITTALSVPGVTLREPWASEAPGLSADEWRWRRVVEIDGKPAASGGVLFHYNPPYGDIYMDVEEPYRQRGLGSFLVQELKRLCYEGGHVPAARCSPSNIASARTLQRAGFVPCGHILKGVL